MRTLSLLLAVTFGMTGNVGLDRQEAGTAILDQEALLLSREWVDRLPENESDSYCYYRFQKVGGEGRGFYATVTPGSITKREFRFYVDGGLYLTLEDTGEEWMTPFGVYPVDKPTHDFQLEMKEDPCRDGMYGKYLSRKGS